jgi:hypothetical protein
LISCASNTLSRKCIPSGKNGMIEAIYGPPFPRPRKAKRRFAAVVHTDFRKVCLAAERARGSRFIAM